MTAKTQISLDIHSVWLETSLSAYRRFRSLVNYKAYSEDWSDRVDAQADLGFCCNNFSKSQIL